MYDPRAEDVRYAHTEEGWVRLPIRVVAEPEPDDVTAEEIAMWTAQLREWIESHPGVPFFFTERGFHVGCQRHARAREVLRTGHIPAGFWCPLAREACPFARVSEAASTSLRLRVRAARPAAVLRTSVSSFSEKRRAKRASGRRGTRSGSRSRIHSCKAGVGTTP